MGELIATLVILIMGCWLLWMALSFAAHEWRHTIRELVEMWKEFFGR